MGLASGLICVLAGVLLFTSGVCEAIKIAVDILGKKLENF